jgi:hypothetical protein
VDPSGSSGWVQVDPVDPVDPVERRWAWHSVMLSAVSASATLSLLVRGEQLLCCASADSTTSKKLKKNYVRLLRPINPFR